MNIKMFKSKELPQAAFAAVVSMSLAQLCAYLLSGYGLSARALAAGVGAGVGLWLGRLCWRAFHPK